MCRHNLEEKQIRENHGLVRIYHEIPWSSGEMSYDNFFETLSNFSQNTCRVYINGYRNKERRKEYLSNMYNEVT